MSFNVLVSEVAVSSSKGYPNTCIPHARQCKRPSTVHIFNPPSPLISSCKHAHKHHPSATIFQKTYSVVLDIPVTNHEPHTTVSATPDTQKTAIGLPSHTTFTTINPRYKKRPPQTHALVSSHQHPMNPIMELTTILRPAIAAVAFALGFLTVILITIALIFLMVQVLKKIDLHTGLDKAFEKAFDRERTRKRAGEMMEQGREMVLEGGGGGLGRARRC